MKKQVVEEYRHYLRKCKSKALNFLQPSGMLSDNSDLESDISAFCPLPKKVREAVPSIAEEFARKYENYKEKHIRKFEQEVAECSRQIVLVDVQNVLKNGVDAFNDTRQCFSTILDAYKYKEGSWFVDLLRSRFLGKESIRCVAFVATKADQVLRKSQSNMGDLVKGLVLCL